MGRRLATALCLGAGALAACRTAAPPRIETVPDPLLAPLVGAALSDAAARTVGLAVSAAERGDWERAAKLLSGLPQDHPVVRLAQLEARFLRGEDGIGAAALNLAREHHGYAAAWEFAYLAATRAGDPESSLEAARAAAEFRPSARWWEIIRELEKAALDRTLGRAAALLARGDAEGAFRAARDLLNESPGHGGARMLAVRAALAARRPHEAASLVAALEDNAEGLELKGRVAEALEQWDLAAGLFARLPLSHPSRCEMLNGAREQARLVNAPPHVNRALTSTVVTRRGLAALLVWQAPGLVAEADGPVTVFEDIVQIAERDDIVTVTRGRVMSGDALARRFAPDRAVGGRELQAALGRLAAVLGRAEPRWCVGGAAEGCVTIPEQINGRAVAELIREVSGEGGEPCKRR